MVALLYNTIKNNIRLTIIKVNYHPTQNTQTLSFGYTTARARTLLDLLNKDQVYLQKFHNRVYIPAFYDYWKAAKQFTVARNLKLALQIHDHPNLLKLRQQQIELAKNTIAKHATYNGHEAIVIDLDGVIFNEKKLYQQWSHFKKSPIMYLLIRLGLIDKRAPQPIRKYFFKKNLDPWLAKNSHEIYEDMTKLIQEFQAKNIKVIGATGRPETLERITRRNLKELGNIHLDELILKPQIAADNGHEIGHKKKALMKISEKYNILAAFGDNPADLLPHNLEGFSLINTKNTVNVHLPNSLNSAGN